MKRGSRRLVSKESDMMLYEATQELAMAHDYVGLVRYLFPWGEPGTALAPTEADPEPGPDKWQVEVLEEIGRREAADTGSAIQVAVSTGHGPGKTALVAWIILIFLSTRIRPQIVVTSNTQNQLLTKTWRELAKWHELAINRHWFAWTATKFYHVEAPAVWYATAIPWSENRSEAFAGTHEENVLMLFDEASAIPDNIWEVASGAMTTPGAMWLVFGNPTRNTGRFKECWGRYRHRWSTFTVDSRTAKKTNKKQLQEWIDDYGDDSDFVRVRVKGEFPRASSMQFIGEDVARAAANRGYEADEYRHAPIVVGADIARFGDDQTVVYVRQGLKTHHIARYRELDVMQSASVVAATADEWNADAVMVDVVGIGAGVVDRLAQLGYGRVVFGVNAGAAAASKRYANKRAEMWGAMRDWLKNGGQIPDDSELITDLTSPEYGYTASEAIQLEKKSDMKARGLASPDSGDALALTFAFPVSRRSRADDADDEGEYDYRHEALAGVRAAMNRGVTGY